MYLSSNPKVREAVQDIHVKSYDELDENEINHLTAVVMKEHYEKDAHEIIFLAEDIYKAEEAFKEALLAETPVEQAKAIHRFFKAFAKNAAAHMRDEIEEAINEVQAWRSNDAPFDEDWRPSDTASNNAWQDSAA